MTKPGWTVAEMFLKPDQPTRPEEQKMISIISILSTDPLIMVPAPQHLDIKAVLSPADEPDHRDHCTEGCPCSIHTSPNRQKKI